MPTPKGRSPGQILIIGLLSLFFEDGASPGFPDPPTLLNTRRSRTALERMPTVKMYTSRRSGNLAQEPLILKGRKVGWMHAQAVGGGHTTHRFYLLCSGRRYAVATYAPHTRACVGAPCPFAQVNSTRRGNPKLFVNA